MSNGTTVEAAINGKLASNGTAAAATKLATARSIRTNLASTAAASFNGTANITPGVTGVLPVANGGTGTNNLAGLASSVGGLNFTKLFEINYTCDADNTDRYRQITGTPTSYFHIDASCDSAKYIPIVSEYDIIAIKLIWTNLKIAPTSSTYTYFKICVGPYNGGAWAVSYAIPLATTAKVFSGNSTNLLFADGAVRIPNEELSYRAYNGYGADDITMACWLCHTNPGDLVSVKIYAGSKIQYVYYGAKITLP